MVNSESMSPSPASSASSMQWYVLQVYSGCELYVMDALRRRIKETQKENLFGDMIVPKEKVVEMKRGQKCTSERKYFPGYVLIQMVMNDDTWHLVKSVPKISGFVGGQKPTPLNLKEMQDIRNRMQAGVDQPKPKIVYQVGEVVRIKEGPFADFNGVVEEVNYEKNRLRVAVLIFGRSTPVELEFGQVEKC